MAITRAPLVVSSGAFNVKDYGAKGDNTTDDTTAIQAAINAATTAGRGMVFLPSGRYVVSATLTIPTKGVYLVGAGRYATRIVPSTGFTASNNAIIYITNDNCGVRDLALAFSSATSANNPAANGIQVTGARYAELRSLDFSGINGYAIEVTASASVAPFGNMISTVHVIHCAGGIHLISNGSGSNGNGMQSWVTDANLEICDSLDCLLIEDSNDVLIENLNGAAAQGSATNSMVHIKGKCSSVFITNPDVGVYPGPASAPTVLIEAGPNGVPADVTFMNGVIQAGSPNLRVTDGNGVGFAGVTFKNSQTHGVDISNVSTSIAFDSCRFKTNNQAAGTSYDVNMSMSTQFAFFRNCVFLTPVATGVAGSVPNVVNDVNHRGYFLACAFSGSGGAPSTVFSSGTPQIIRNCSGYNPRGGITAPTITASPFTTNSSQNDVNIVFTSSTANITALKIGGTNIGTPVQGAAYRVPARSSIEVDYTSTAPTWIWIAD